MEIFEVASYVWAQHTKLGFGMPNISNNRGKNVWGHNSMNQVYCTQEIKKSSGYWEK